MDSEWNSTHPCKVDKAEGCVLCLHFIFLLIIPASKIKTTSQSRHIQKMQEGYAQGQMEDIRNLNQELAERWDENLPSFATWEFNGFHCNEKNYTVESLNSLIIWCLKIFSFVLSQCPNMGMICKDIDNLLDFTEIHRSWETLSRFRKQSPSLGTTIKCGNPAPGVSVWNFCLIFALKCLLW